MYGALLAMPGCVGGVFKSPCDFWPSGECELPTVRAPHAKFHPVPTRPVFAPPWSESLPPKVFQPIPWETVEPPSGTAPAGAPDIPPVVQPPGSGEPENSKGELPEPRKLVIPEGVPPTSRRILGQEYY